MGYDIIGGIHGHAGALTPVWLYARITATTFNVREQDIRSPHARGAPSTASKEHLAEPADAPALGLQFVLLLRGLTHETS